MQRYVDFALGLALTGLSVVEAMKGDAAVAIALIGVAYLMPRKADKPAP